MSDTEIGERVGLSRTAARRRRKKLEDEGLVDVLGVLVLQEADFAYADVFVTLDSKVNTEDLDAFLEEVKDEVIGIDTDGENSAQVKVMLPCGNKCSGYPHRPYEYQVQRDGESLNWEYASRSTS